MGVSVRILICFALLLNFVAALSPADKVCAEMDDVAEETAFLTTETEGHEIIRLAYAESRMAQAGPTGDDSSQKKAGHAGGSDEDSVGSDPWEDEAESIDSIPDPLEPMNRAFFAFNDKVYFWVFKPIGTGYNMVVPEVARVSIRNFFTNLVMPIRAISCLLQGKFEGFGIELVRCLVNTTAGFLGFQDVARQALDFQIQDEDLGQVFAFYGIGPGCYLNLPFLGASSLRDTAGWVGGLFLNPLDYIVEDFWSNVGFRGFDMLNKTSLRIGEYEALKKAALDPYVAMRDAYYQYRLNQIEK
ncbi:MAG: VacJ family lipoprotein [Deltaproteobacteria bacterium]|nr:VacJ family lipoprotein [Deltaproteobacteria bacterium]